MHNKQVNKDHYEFFKYFDKRRWVSVWHQVDEVVALTPRKVLEVGIGSGLFKTVACAFGLSVETLDVDPELKPDYVGSAVAMPFDDGDYDVVCAFQMLEHLPFDESLKAFQEMARVAKSNVVVSLPDAQNVWRYIFHVPKMGERQVLVRRPGWRPTNHQFDGEHHWEVNKSNYALEEVIRCFESTANARLLKTYRVMENPYHRFFVFDTKLPSR